MRLVPSGPRVASRGSLRASSLRAMAGVRGLLALALLGALPGAAVGVVVEESTLPAFDFTQPETVAEWQPTNHVAAVRAEPEGLAIDIDGFDPFVTGPPRDYPQGVPLRISVRIKPEVEGNLQIFHFQTRASEERSVAFPVRAGIWNDVRAMLPPLGPNTRLRIDPPGRTGTAVVARIDFSSAVPLPAPQWPPHERFDTAGGPSLESGPLLLEVSQRGFSLAVDGRRVAASHARPMAGYRADGEMRWVDLGVPADVTEVVAARDPGSGAASPSSARVIEMRQTIRDLDGGTWTCRRRFSVGRVPGTIDLETTVRVDADRRVAFVPMVLLVAHEGTPHKQQAVFPGLEYLADEPSSSEADLVGPQSRRQVPANHKITFPMMAVAHEGRVVGLTWDHTPSLAALFDSPDRVLASGGHLLGVIAPGSDGFNRHEGDLMPLDAVPLAAGEELVLRATLSGGAGDTIVPAVRGFVERRGLPEVSDVGGLADYVRLASAGWLDSAARAGGRFRHAIGENFPPQPAADAAVYLSWLAGHAHDGDAAGRLDEASAEALAAVPAGSLDAAMVGHVRMPVQSLVFGRLEETLAAHAARARRLLDSVRPDGTVAYRAPSGGVDYGRTHDADHANGVSAGVVADALESARFAGDGPLIDEAVTALRRLGSTYAGGVPRGAQTWEVPLHTPDILASAHLVRAFTIGHELTGDPALLEQAVTWAWTGLPFLYLIDPVGTPDGPYGCVTVFGATGWKWPVWIGRPVQWCGLVYAHALYRLARHDPAGPWKRLADGITATGIRYSWPVAESEAAGDAREKQGLLPDGWEVLEAFRVDPPINPGTVQACAVELFGQGPLYDCRVLPWGDGRMVVHAPGAIELAGVENAASDAAGTSSGVVFTVQGWPRQPYTVLVSGLAAPPQLTIDGEPVSLSPPHRHDPATGRLVLELDGSRTIGLRPGAAHGHAP
jgi:hypothetical protein